MELTASVKKADVGIALYLLAAVTFFVIPIPNFVLDIMIAFNISVALIILMNVLFVQEVLRSEEHTSELQSR